MAFLINPNVAYLLTVTAVMLVILTTVLPKSYAVKIGMVLCLGLAAYEYSQLNGNLITLILVALSPLPFFIAIQQTRSQSFLVLLTIVLLTIGSAFLFGDLNGTSPHVAYGLAGIVALFYGRGIWVIYLRVLNNRTVKLSDQPNSLIGLVGEARSEIPVHSTGSVEVEGDLWMARSETPIPAGSLVRIVNFDGLVITVQKVERLSQKIKK